MLDYLLNYDFYDTCLENANLLTNFSESQLPLYQKAVKQFGDETLYIDDVAYDRFGRKLPGYYALRTTLRYEDRSKFWRFFESLREEFYSNEDKNNE